jgi:hypothetical protein
MRAVTHISRSLVLALLILNQTPCRAQAPTKNPATPSEAAEPAEDFKVYNEHPQLLLTSQRLRLLRRERERHSGRWQQFDTLVTGKAQMPEPGFSYALHYQISLDKASAQTAITWALGPGTDLRQLALVFDWCQDAMNPTQSKALVQKIQKYYDAAGRTQDLASMRSRLFALIATFNESPARDPEAIKQLILTQWRKQTAPALEAGSLKLKRAEIYPVFEMLHVVRDNFNIDLREDARKFFKDLPAQELLTYYPAAYPAAENEYRVPYFSGNEPDLRDALMSRVAELAMVAYDTNSRESQFLQGWLIHDRFTLRGALGVGYELLWANPYQPGLSYYHLPLKSHNPLSGELFLRSSWDDDATWFGYFDGQFQMFRDGKIQVLKKGAPAPLQIGDSIVMPGTPHMKFQASGEEAVSYFVVQLKPRHKYWIEVDDEELAEEETDSGGILAITVIRKEKIGVRIKEQ